MARTPHKIDALQAVLYAALVGSTLTMGTMEDITLSAAHDEEDPTLGPAGCANGGVTWQMLPASTVNHETAAAGDDVSVVWTWDVPYRWRVAIDVRGCEPEHLQSELLAAVRQIVNLITAALQPPATGAPCYPLVGMTLATPYRHRTATDFYMLEGTVRLRFSWGRS